MSEITLRAGKYEATFRPDAAMLCASLRHGGDEYVAWPRTLDEFRAGRATAIPLVHPWANRLAGDSYRAAGVDVSLTGLTLPRDPNAAYLDRFLVVVLATARIDWLRPA